MFLKAHHRVLIALLEKGPLQNSEIAKSVGVTEQWCSKIVNVLEVDGLVESKSEHPRKIIRLTEKGEEIARRLKEVSEKL